jgi:hypothetical protein
MMNMVFVGLFIAKRMVIALFFVLMKSATTKPEHAIPVTREKKWAWLRQASRSRVWHLARRD